MPLIAASGFIRDFRRRVGGLVIFRSDGRARALATVSTGVTVIGGRMVRVERPRAKTAPGFVCDFRR